MFQDNPLKDVRDIFAEDILLTQDQALKHFYSLYHPLFILNTFKEFLKKSEQRELLIDWFKDHRKDWKKEEMGELKSFLIEEFQKIESSEDLQFFFRKKSKIRTLF